MFNLKLFNLFLCKRNHKILQFVHVVGIINLFTGKINIRITTDDSDETLTIKQKLSKNASIVSTFLLNLLL